MQRLPVEAWTAILCITAGPLHDLDEMTGAEGDVASWRTCLCVEIVSKGVRQHVHPCIAQMLVSHPRQLLILAWKMRRGIKMEVDLEQLDSKPWSLDNRKMDTRVHLCGRMVCVTDTEYSMMYRRPRSHYDPSHFVDSPLRT